MAHHGVKATFTIEGETQIVQGKELGTPEAGFRFGRLFPQLPAFRPMDGALAKLGERITFEPAEGEPPLPRANSQIPAGYTYFGQFIDHDITRDGTQGRVEDTPEQPDDSVLQVRSPRLDLDSLYGHPEGRLEVLYDVDDPTLFRIGTTTPLPGFGQTAAGDPVGAGHPNDLPRVAFGAEAGKPLIGDDRNDENLVVAQLHLAFLKFHNKTVAALRTLSPDDSAEEIFKRARILVTCHYQWLVLDDFVRRIVDPRIFEAVLGVPALPLAGGTLKLDPLFFRVTGYETPAMPLEFSVAAYRLGHSMVRAGYAWNRFFQGPGDGQTTFGAATLRQLFHFTNTSGGLGKPDNTAAAPANGFVTLPSNWIVDWHRFFDFSDAIADPPAPRFAVANSIDTRIAGELGRLQGGGGNLAVRNLIRGSRRGLPAGQDVAALMDQAGGLAGDAPLTPAQVLKAVPPAGDPVLLGDNKALREHEFDVKTPLWYYILREAELAGGEHLGPVGSRIVVETFVGFIRASVTSIFNADVAPAALANPHKAGTLEVFSPVTGSPLRTPAGEPITTVAHLLAFVDDLNPLG
ncbi:heme peroxidase family protein [Starkeya koreensis]|uniref:Heme peroxidase family protein n=1 Tax=Ancylobacter koreensis TaxID=266121 RepID=A0ABT0DM21_9HYPH|nr:heme peroxidase family protein [Ancylobacter koreensis]MCK0208254.1 heme peroxidase family protein [Ancylobacter koreensis]